MRALIILLVIAFLLFGAAFGALNPQAVAYDFLFMHADVPKGAALLIAILIGWLLGGAMCLAASGIARQRALRKPQREREPGA